MATVLNFLFYFLFLSMLSGRKKGGGSGGLFQKCPRISFGQDYMPYTTLAGKRLRN